MENHVVEYYYAKKKQIEYFVDQNGKLHREDGPAFISYYENGNIKYVLYFINYKQHRLEGPAFILYNEDGSIKDQEYWINGERYKDMFLYSVAVGSLKEA